MLILWNKNKKLNTIKKNIAHALSTTETLFFIVHFLLEPEVQISLSALAMFGEC